MKVMHALAVIDGRLHTWPVTPSVEKRFETAMKMPIKSVEQNTDLNRLTHMAATAAGDTTDTFDVWLDTVTATSFEQVDVPLVEGSFEAPSTGASSLSPSSPAQD